MFIYLFFVANSLICFYVIFFSVPIGEEDVLNMEAVFNK